MKETNTRLITMGAAIAALYVVLTLIANAFGLANYAIQVHYFTSHDYNNSSFVKEVDDRIGDDMSNIHNHNYGPYSQLMHVYEFIMGVFNQKNN